MTNRTQIWLAFAGEFSDVSHKQVYLSNYKSILGYTLWGHVKFRCLYGSFWRRFTCCFLGLLSTIGRLISVQLWCVICKLILEQLTSGKFKKNDSGFWLTFLRSIIKSWEARVFQGPSCGEHYWVIMMKFFTFGNGKTRTCTMLIQYLLSVTWCNGILICGDV